MTPRKWTAATIGVEAALLISLPVDAVAADDRGAQSQLTVNGQPLSRLLHIDPITPFGFEPGLAGLDTAGGAQQTGDDGEQGGSRRKSVLIGGAIGLGAGLFMGGAACSNGGSWACRYASLGGLGGFAFGALIGALLGN